MQAFDDVPQLYIDPVECIDCSACVPVCPVSAIFALDDLLSLFLKGASAYTGLLHPPQAVEKSRNHDVFRTVSARCCQINADTSAFRYGRRWLASGMQEPKEAVQLSFRLPASGVAVDAVGAVVWGDEKRRESSSPTSVRRVSSRFSNT
jgi:ferredoxin